MGLIQGFRDLGIEGNLSILISAARNKKTSLSSKPK
jgi:hypothetical protein